MDRDSKSVYPVLALNVINGHLSLETPASSLKYVLQYYHDKYTSRLSNDLTVGTCSGIKNMLLNVRLIYSVTHVCFNEDICKPSLPKEKHVLVRLNCAGFCICI